MKIKGTTSIIAALQIKLMLSILSANHLEQLLVEKGLLSQEDLEEVTSRVKASISYALPQFFEDFNVLTERLGEFFNEKEFLDEHPGVSAKEARDIWFQTLVAYAKKIE